MSVNELRWEWIIPDKPGVWAFGGNEAKIPWGSAGIVVRRGENKAVVPGWWCFLMPLPEIIPPKKQVVWRMWIVQYEDKYWQFRPYWVKDGEQPEIPNAIRTDKTEEREE